MHVLKLFEGHPYSSSFDNTKVSKELERFEQDFEAAKKDWSAAAKVEDRFCPHVDQSVLFKFNDSEWCRWEIFADSLCLPAFVSQ